MLNIYFKNRGFYKASNSCQNKTKCLSIIFICLLSIFFLTTYYKGSSILLIKQVKKTFSVKAKIESNDNTYAVGNLQSNFHVTPTGAANYSIPIVMPKGTGDMAPLLTINYNSQQNNGLLGMGFSLEGLTAITRCPSNMTKNGVIHGVDYTYKDRFCLNGEQLVAIKGLYGMDKTEYRTYISTNTKIISYGRKGNGPEGFKIWTKNGQIAEYGLTKDSQIYADEKETIAIFSLNKIQDRAGNYISIQYNKDIKNEELYPDTITYTGNDAAKIKPYNTVKFSYQDRQDDITMYRAGSAFVIAKLLNKIQIFTDSKLTYEYKLDYEASQNTNRSLLNSIQKCSYDGKCLPPIKFSWQISQSPTWQIAPEYATKIPLTERLGAHFIDLNGNGLSDLIIKKDLQLLKHTNVELNTGSGWTQGQINYSPPVSTAIDSGVHFVDLNGDGLLDIAQTISNESNSTFESNAWINRGNGWEKANQYATPFEIASGTKGVGIGLFNVSGKKDAGTRFIDLNGDGLLDAIQYGINDDFIKIGAWINNGESWQSDLNHTFPAIISEHGEDTGVRFLDLNGDGLVDAVQHQKNKYGKVINSAWINTGSGWEFSYNHKLPVPTIEHGKSTGICFIDLNGDGLLDLVESWKQDGKIRQSAWINTGDGWRHSPNYNLPVLISDNGEDMGVRFVDLNGDGILDIIQYHGSEKSAWINNGKGWESARHYMPPMSKAQYGDDDGLRFEDLNGDGIDDMLIGNSRFKHGAWINTHKKPDLLIGITDSFNNEFQITYDSIVNKQIYTRCHDSKYPYTDIQKPFYVVSETENNKYPENITEYRYVGAKIHNLGMGFLGFKQITATSKGSGLSVTTTYSQNIENHTVGQIISSETHSQAGKLLSSTKNIWECRTFGNKTLNHAYYMPYTKKIIETYYTLTGNFLSTKTTDITVDDYENPLNLNTETKDKTGVYQIIAENAYQNDPNKWLIGSLVHTTVTAISTDKPSITRTSSHKYSKETGMLLQSVTEPNDAKYTLITDYERDIFGNIVKTSNSGIDLETREVTNIYDKTGRFIIKTINALGHATSQIIDNKLGKPIQITDQNGLTTTYTYDSFGHTLETKYPNDLKTTISYDWNPTAYKGSIYSITTKNTNSITQISYHDSENRKIAETTQGLNGEMILKTTAYDELGRIRKQSIHYLLGSSPQYTTIEYDELDRVAKTTHPNDTSTLVYYNGPTTIIKNSLGQTTTKTINARGSLLRRTDNLGHSINYNYDSFGNVIKIQDSSNNVTHITYDRLGRRIALKDPDKGLWTYTYNVLDELTNQNDALNQKTKFQYDKLGRILSRQDKAGISLWKYDTAKYGIGKLAEISGVSGGNNSIPTSSDIITALQDGLINYKRTYFYDSLSRPIQTTFSFNNVNYVNSVSYDNSSRPSIETYPSGLQIKNSYNHLGFITRIENAKNGTIYWKLNSMDAASRITSETHQNGLITNYKYDAKTNFLTSINTVKNQTLTLSQSILSQTGNAANVDQKTSVSTTNNISIQNLHYDYDSLGNIKTRQDLTNNMLEKFNYDSLNRLTTANLNNKEITTWQYDDIGNITYKSDIGQYIYGENGAGPHALTSVKNKDYLAQFSYNRNGDQINATIKGEKRALKYTSYSKPHYIVNEKGTTSFYYNAEREHCARVDKFSNGKSIVTFYMGNFELVSTKDKHNYETSQKHYIGGSTIHIKHYNHNNKKSTDQMLTLLHDNIGSVTDITDENANSISRFYYTPFGEQKQIFGQKPEYPHINKGFTGHERIEMSNLIHMGGRIYDPFFCRFLSADPFVQNPDDMQTLNRYSYCANNPMRYVDKSGYSFFDDIISCFGGLIVGIGSGIIQAIQNQNVEQMLLLATGSLSGGAAWYVMPIASATVSASHGGNFSDIMKSAALAFAQVESWSITYNLTSNLGKSAGLTGFIEKSESVLIHGGVGGGLSSISGGSFKDGFISSATIESASGWIDSIGKEGSNKIGIMKRSAASGIIGGTSASLSGGNFANGATTSTFSRMFSEETKLFIEEHEQKFMTQEGMEAQMGPNAIVFADVALTCMPGKTMIRDVFLNTLHMEVSHKEIFYTDNSGHLSNIGFNGFGTGIHRDERFNPSNLSPYHFGPISHNVHISSTTLYPIDYLNPKSYNLIFHNCQHYADTIRRLLQLPKNAI